MQSRKLECPNCGAAVPAEQINVQQMVAVCPNCDTVFNFGNGEGGAWQPEKAKQKFKDVPMPERFQVDESEHKLTISYSWFTPMAFFITFFAVFWNAISWTIFGGDGFGPISEGFFIFALFPLIFPAVGLGLIYYNVAQYINRTYIVVGKGELRAYSRPLPTLNNLRLDHSTIHQLFVKQRVNHGKNGVSISYDVLAVLHGGKRQQIVGSLAQADQALFIEQEIEHYLGIDDTPVSGEYRSNSY